MAKNSEKFTDLSFLKSDKKLCYRLEKNGIGPFCHRLTREKFLDIRHTEETPIPCIDFDNCFGYLAKNNLFKDFIFGFNNFEDIYKWFDAETLNFLKLKKFKLFLYETTEYIESEKQVMFKKNKAKKIMRFKY